MQCRQRLVDLRAITGDDGIERCEIVFDPEVILTEWQPKRPFQGWRYLDAKDAPRDLAALGGSIGDDMPAALKAELSGARAALAGADAVTVSCGGNCH